jgi:hypothetical protein
MPNLRRVLLIAIPLMALACASTPLLPRVEDGDPIPPDFVFQYTLDRTKVANSESGAPAEAKPAEAKPAEEQPAEANPAEAMPAEEKPAEEKPAETQPPEEENAPVPARPDLLGLKKEMPQDEAADLLLTGSGPLPAFFSFDVNADGDASWVVEYHDPVFSRQKGSERVDDATLRKIYERVRAAKLGEMDDRYTGQDPTAGHEIYHVMGEGRRVLYIDVSGTRVDSLTRLWNDVFRMLPAKDVLVPPQQRAKGYVLDKRTGKYHMPDCPEVEKIPAESRIEVKTPQEALNLHGYPCEICNPPTH